MKFGRAPHTLIVLINGESLERPSTNSKNGAGAPLYYQE